MKVNRVFLTATVAVISAVAVSSCAYDPYYSGSPYSSGASYSSGYGSGYGNGYGYGGSNFTTTYFVSTGHSRWGYDPYARCYYDYSRRCYYDPYLNGYYPVGYRPHYVQGAPHPHGWRSGSRYIAPPSRIHDHRLDNYHNRTERYRSLNTDWSRSVRSDTSTRGSDSYRSRYTPYDQHRGGSTRQSYLGTTQRDEPSRTIDRNRNTYVSDLQNSRRSAETRTVQPRQTAPRTSQQEQTIQQERSNRTNRQVEPNQLRSGRSQESVKPEVMRQPENRGINQARAQESRLKEQPASRNTESVEERFPRGR